MKDISVINEILSALFESGYYDPTESYAEANVAILGELSAGKEYKNTFVFKLKNSSMISSLYLDSKLSYLRLSIYFSGDEKTLFKQAFITNFLRDFVTCSIYLDKDNCVVFDHVIFIPTNVKQFMATISHIDTVINKFVTEYNRLYQEYIGDKIK